VKARVVLVIETVSIAGKSAITVPSDCSPQFASNRKALARFRQRWRKSLVLPATADVATETRKLVLFCAVPSSGQVHAAPQTD
jgi:hypothetical protein